MELKMRRHNTIFKLKKQIYDSTLLIPGHSNIYEKRDWSSQSVKLKQTKIW